MSQRRSDIDWLRVMAVAMLVPFHTGMIFCLWGFHLKNDELSVALTVQNAFINLWHMPLFFFLSGAGTWMALDIRGFGEYARERASRLMLPFFFGLAAMCPPQLYFERLQKGEFSGSFIKFYPHFFNGPYPDGNLSWQHLWFLLYLFLMSMIAIPILRYLRSERGQAVRDKLASLASRRTAIIALPLPFLVIQCVAGEGWPNGNQNLIGDMDNFAQHFFVFLYGCMLCSSDKFWRGAEKNRLFFGIAGIACFATTQAIEYSDAINVVRGNPAAGIGWLILRAVGTWGLLLSILGYGKRHLNFTNKFLGYASEAALPFYIIHQTVIIIIGYYVVQTGWSVAAKYLIVVVASFGGTAVAYETLVRRWAATRFLFGMRKNKRHRA